MSRLRYHRRQARHNQSAVCQLQPPDKAPGGNLSSKYMQNNPQ
jgi:hypothetical protein